MRIGIVAPHIFMHGEILPRVIFSPGQLAIDLAEGVAALGTEVTLFSPGGVKTTVRNLTADLSYFEQELAGRGDGYIDLLKKHPLTFITLARQVQSELIARALAMANRDELDVVHIYTNEEDIALPFARLCMKPVVFTHHDPFNFLVKYKNVFPKYAHLSWISMSLAQRRGMPQETNWVGNVYHGLDPAIFAPVDHPKDTMFQFDLTKGKLRLHLYQRSWDVFLGAPFNIAQYAMLLHMVAHIIGAEPRELIISAGNAHLYKNHLEPAKEQLIRKPYPFPKLKIVGDVKNIDDFTEENFVLEGYEAHPRIQADLVIL